MVIKIKLIFKDKPLKHSKGSLLLFSGVEHLIINQGTQFLRAVL